MDLSALVIRKNHQLLVWDSSGFSPCVNQGFQAFGHQCVSACFLQIHLRWFVCSKMECCVPRGYMRMETLIICTIGLAIHLDISKHKSKTKFSRLHASVTITTIAMVRTPSDSHLRELASEPTGQEPSFQKWSWPFWVECWLRQVAPKNFALTWEAPFEV